jgi:hypothetical protein
MGEFLTYRQRTVDIVHIAPGQPVPAKIGLFEAPPYPYVNGSTRVTEFDEKLIVRWLMFYPAAREIILEALRLPTTAFYCPEVVSPFYMPSEGEIDLILYPPWSPSEAFALACKRVKVESVNADEDKITKLQHVGGGVCQVKRLYDRHAFSQTYLAIITEVDATGQDDRDVFARGIRSHTTPQCGKDTKTKTFTQIVEFPGRSELDLKPYDDIGIIHIEIVQPSRFPIDKQATVAICVFRRAQKREQGIDVTNRVREIMRSDAR